MFTVQQHFQDNIHAPITLEEMWNTIKSIRTTTPGPDGISNLCIKMLWYILGPIILDAWNYSLATNNLPPSNKTSLIRLIPKRDKDTTLIKNWRPITLSNCDHKLITRLIIEYLRQLKMKSLILKQRTKKAATYQTILDYLVQQ